MVRIPPDEFPGLIDQCMTETFMLFMSMVETRPCRPFFNSYTKVHTRHRYSAYLAIQWASDTEGRFPSDQMTLMTSLSALLSWASPALWILISDIKCSLMRGERERRLRKFWRWKHQRKKSRSVRQSLYRTVLPECWPTAGVPRNFCVGKKVAQLFYLHVH